MACSGTINIDLCLFNKGADEVSAYLPIKQPHISALERGSGVKHQWQLSKPADEL